MEIKEKKKEIKLTERELLILRYIAAGYSDAEIAQYMNLVISTLRRAIDTLYRKVDVYNRVTLVAWGFRNKYLK